MEEVDNKSANRNKSRISFSVYFSSVSILNVRKTERSTHTLYNFRKYGSEIIVWAI